MNEWIFHLITVSFFIIIPSGILSFDLSRAAVYSFNQYDPFEVPEQKGFSECHSLKVVFCFSWSIEIFEKSCGLFY